MLHFILAIALLSKLDSTFGDDYPMVKIKNGMVRGKYIETKFGPILKKVSFFQGIPFGKAERFSKPKPADPWEGVYDATSPKASCYQFGSDPFKLQIQSETKKLKQSEDCLFLNVWVPEKYESGSVMFWVYGGGFLFGTIFSDYYDARQLAADGDVIVVAVNYRLGPLGFLYGDDSSAPGNVGLHDQVLGLKWVHENIESFGGNTSKVTIFGESAGSMSIGSLIISPLTKGLFHRAILQSGAPTELVTYSKQLATWRTKSFATKAGCSCNQTMKSIVECLRKKSILTLSIAYLKELINRKIFYPIYGDELMPVRHVQALKSGKFNRNIDLIYGVVRDEGSIFTESSFPEIFVPFAKVTKKTAKISIYHLIDIMYNRVNKKEIANFYIDQLPDKANITQFKYVTQ